MPLRFSAHPFIQLLFLNGVFFFFAQLYTFKELNNEQMMTTAHHRPPIIPLNILPNTTPQHHPPS